MSPAPEQVAAPQMGVPARGWGRLRHYYGVVGLIWHTLSPMLVADTKQ